MTEYTRLYEREFQRTTAVDGDTALKHKPSLIIHADGTASVVVGAENNVSANGAIVYHPMSDSSDADLVHWIQAQGSAQ